MQKICSLPRFSEIIKNKVLVFIGAGKRAVSLINKYGWYVSYCIDSNPEKDGAFLDTNIGAIPVHGWKYLRNNVGPDTVLMITPTNFIELQKQVENEPVLNDVDFYIPSFMELFNWDVARIEVSKVPYEITKGTTPKIPKTIHYFWFSGDPYPEKVQKCIDSWHKFCPDYEFKKWDLANYKTDCKYANMALQQKLWAAASDYGRCDVVCRYGGIYLDTDVELVKSLDDLLYDSGFFCFEDVTDIDPGSGFGAEKDNPIIKEICATYEKLDCECIYKETDDGLDIQRVNIAAQYTGVLERHGLKKTGQYQNVEGIAVYPPLVLSPYSYMTGITTMHEKTYGIHHWVSNWITAKAKDAMNKRKAFIKEHLTDGKIL